MDNIYQLLDKEQLNLNTGVSEKKKTDAAEAYTDLFFLEVIRLHVVLFNPLLHQAFEYATIDTLKHGI